MSEWSIASLLSPDSSENTGVLPQADIEAMFQSMYDHANSEPWMIYVSPEDARRIWRLVQRSALYHRYRLPKRRLRKVALRRRQALIEQGRRRIAKDECEIYDRAPILPPYEG